MYKILSEKPFKDERISISYDDKEVTKWLILEYMTHFFGIEIVDTFNYRSCNMKNSRKVTVDDKLILSFEELFPYNENVKIYHEKYHKLSEKSVTFNNILDKHLKETEIYD